MRMIIKNADFSSVSIGKIVRDLSFSVAYSDGNDVLNSFFVNWNSGTPTVTKIYTGSQGDETFNIESSVNRITTDYLEVIEGMTITSTHISNTASVPMFVAFDKNKNVLPAKSGWKNSGNVDTYTVPTGVSYIKFQCQILSSASSVVGQMPV